MALVSRPSQAARKPPSGAAPPAGLEFASLAFPSDRKVLTPREVARRWHCSEQHVIDLLEGGVLAGFDIAGPNHYLRVPATFIDLVARKLRVTPATVREWAKTAPPGSPPKRAHWRVPVEGYVGFIKKRHSLYKI